MSNDILSLKLESEEATNRLGEDLAVIMRCGDLITLSGDLGAGKTTLARSLIRALCGDAEMEVPSPTYTLAQSYEGKIPAVHFDFYRLSSPGEIDELGLEDALAEGAAIVEWPEHAGTALPEPSIAIRLSGSEGVRTAEISGDTATIARVHRSLNVRKFLENRGWRPARRIPLVGDASTRAYEIVKKAGREECLLMDAAAQPDGPPVRDGLSYSRIAHLAESVAPFVAVASELRAQGFSAPEVHAADLDQGILLIEHLGDGSFLDDSGNPVPERYQAAAALLAEFHRKTWPREIEGPFGARHQVPPYDRGAMMIEVELLLDWYVPAITGRDIDEEQRHAYRTAWNEVFDTLSDAETSLVMRDFHSPNIVWRRAREGNDRLGLIDFQDALIGPSAYDVASLAMDARVTIPDELEADITAHYCRKRAAGGPFDETGFRQTYSVMAAQRASKILGIFVRLDRRDGKPGYLKHLPRMRDYARRSLQHPALEPVRLLYEDWGLLQETRA